MPTTDQLSADIEAAITAGEAEIGDLSALVHSTASRVNALIGFRAALADLQANPNDLELARIRAAVLKLKFPAATAA
ncbi:MAG: hypothetical protein E8A46_26385 [Bradyrhizobium sp.]|jgi:hypothetical protein|uniref:hypothetical protein n=1 Tax=Bradyrhizobium sp. TaxID=376 RepID=UPI001202224C|nr:hypothetical protein [Bradyrhizobium sp.]THD46587.1 MAG: hypothetical protein E8A46_26385 [Bradyrhizobium sp.]